MRPRAYSAAVAVGSSIWLATLSLLVVPLYIKLLGIEAYGVIGFFVSLQAILQILDLGLAPAVNRELARLSALERLDEARLLVVSLAPIYWTMGVFLACGVASAAPLIAGAWLNSSRLSIADLTEAIMTMGVIIACRWPVALYYNVLVGLDRLALASTVIVVAGTATVILGVLALTFVATDLRALFVAQAIPAAVVAVVMRATAWRALGKGVALRPRLEPLKRIGRFSAGMLGITLTGLAVTQIDKAILSGLLPLAAFGEYMLAIAIVGVLIVLINPLFSLIFPRFSALVATNDTVGLRHLYEDGGRLFAVIYFAIVLALALYGFDAVWLWTGNKELAGRIAPLVTLLCVGTGINGVMYFPYALQLAHGMTRVPLIINIALLLLLVPLVFFLTQRNGALGGAQAWALLQITYLFVGTIVTHRLVAAGSAGRWLLRSVVGPFSVCALSAIVTFPLIDRMPPGSFLKLLSVAVCGLLGPAGYVLASPKLRSLLSTQFLPPQSRQRPDAA